jgi:hypothetical protein
MQRNYWATHPKTKWTGLVLGTLVLLIVLFLIFFDWNYFKPTVARLISEKTHRQTRIAGNLKVHIWSWEPSAEVDGLTMKNPSWAQHEVMFHADRLVVSVSLGRLLRGQLVIPRVEVVKPALDMEREADGRASWEFADRAGKPPPSTNKTPPAKLPPIRRLLIEDGTVRVHDQIRKLMLEGSLNAADEAGREGGFNLKCSGSLNEKPFHAQVHGGPLINLDPDHPYDLEAHVTASDIVLDTHVVFPKPFDMASYRLKFSVSGRDLADVYYLTGLALPNTPPYQLSADVTHSGTVFRTDDLKGKLGSSDIEGMMAVDAASKKPLLTAKLQSNKLDMKDVAPTLGHPATGPAASLNNPAPSSGKVQAPASRHTSKRPPPPPPAAPAQRLFPDAKLQVNRVRAMNADVTYHADSVNAPKVPMKEVEFHLRLDDGLLRIDPLSFVLAVGKFSGSVMIDARKDVPDIGIDMSAKDIDLGQFKPAALKQPPLEGMLVGRLNVHGRGTSVHDLASTADGYFSVALPHGDMNKAFAELTGIDVVHGLGLLLSNKDKDTGIRCGIVDFQAQKGMLDAKSIFIDTTPVVITAKGDVNLKDETLDLSMQGHPKKVSFLRLRTPITLTGTLLHPSVGIKASHLLAQAGVAAVLGTLLTPAAAALALVDPGLAKDKNCEAVFAEARSDATDQKPATEGGQPPSTQRGQPPSSSQPSTSEPPPTSSDAP